MPTTTESSVDADQSPAPFSFTFEFGDSQHCTWRLEELADELTDPALVAFLDLHDDSPDLDTTYQSIRQVIADRSYETDGATVAVPDEVVTVLDEAADRLRPCTTYECMCSSFDWDSEQEWIVSELATIAPTHWSIDKGGSYRIHRGEFTWDDLITHTGAQGWDRAKISFDGTALSVELGGYSCGMRYFTATPMSAPASKLVELWDDWGGCDEEIAEAIADVSDDVVAAVTELWEDLDDVTALNVDVDDFVKESLAYISGLGRALLPVETELIVGLVEDWEGQWTALLETASLIPA